VKQGPLCSESVSSWSVTIFTSQWTVRFLNTTLLHICCVETCPEVAIDRLGTHDLENFFGFVRWDADNIHTPEQMIRTIAHTDIVKEANNDLGLTSLNLVSHNNHFPRSVNLIDST
jgi:hypothetical protein